MELNRREIYRYLGYRGTLPEAEIRERIEELGGRVVRAAQPRHALAPASLKFFENDILELGGIRVESRDLSRNLRDCGEVVFFVATLGLEVDRLISGASRRGRISDGVMLQAAAAALIETYCDQICKDLAVELGPRGLFPRPRFSPGYGDFSIKHQKDLLDYQRLGAGIGLTVTDSMLLAPMKSVTAVIGLGPERKEFEP